MENSLFCQKLEETQRLIKFNIRGDGNRWTVGFEKLNVDISKVNESFMIKNGRQENVYSRKNNEAKLSYHEKA